MDLTTPLSYIKGVGPARAAMLEAKGLSMVEDLLAYVPFRYEDRSNVKAVNELAPGEMATVIAEVRTASLSGFKRRNLGLFEASFTDRSRGILVGKWFHGGYLANVLAPGQKVALFGKVAFDNYAGQLNMLHPEFEILSDDDDAAEAALHLGRVVPVYEAVSKISTRVLRTMVHRVLESVPPVEDQLPEEVRRRLKLPDRWTALKETHFPPQETDMRLLNAFRSQAQFRLIFEEFFWLECGVALKRSKARTMPGISFELTDTVREKVKAMLPFKPTGAQKRVLGQLTGSFTSREKVQLKKLIGAGLAHVAIGTHALLEKDVEFAKLGLAIVDEQDRFGVVPRLEVV